VADVDSVKPPAPLRPFDYDRSAVPADYDRSRVRSPEVLANWMDALAEDVCGEVRTILDLGCGTGRFTGALHERFRARVIGIDPSRKMLGQALRKHAPVEIRLLAGRGEALPIADSSADVVFISMAFHHFADPLRVARECHRVLTRNGCVFLRAGTAERIPSYPITPFFPDAVPIMELVLAPAERIKETFEMAGFRTVRVGELEQEMAPTHAEFAAQLDADGGSVLARLETAQMEAGLRAVHAHARQVDPSPVREVIDFFSFAKPV
jgi:ubiquinone/menaquinone biosynthesis C-methylase UbiE